MPGALAVTGREQQGKIFMFCGASVLLIGNKQQAISIVINNRLCKKVVRAMGDKEKIERNWKC